MKTPNCPISTCKHCRCFHFEGRRGGTCTHLGVFADPNWSSCSLAVPIFSEVLEEQSNVVLLEKSFNLQFLEKQHLTAHREADLFEIAPQNSAVYTEAV